MIIDATEDYLFLDYNKFITIQKNHIFRCDDYDTTELNIKCRTHNGAEVVIWPMLK
jgi:hypothetical protein